MNISLSADRLDAYRRSFGVLSAPELKAIVEGRKPHQLSAETLEALRLLWEERICGGLVIRLACPARERLALKPEAWEWNL